MAHRYFTTCLEQEGSSPCERCNWVERKSLIFFLSWPFHYFLATHLVTHTRKLGCPPLLLLSYSTSNSCILQIRVCKLVGHIWPQNVLCLALCCIKLKKNKKLGSLFLKWDILHENLNVWFPSTKKWKQKPGQYFPTWLHLSCSCPLWKFFSLVFPTYCPVFHLVYFTVLCYLL